jgi:hypothetical protein
VKTGDTATFRDPLSKRIMTVTLMEDVKIYTGSKVKAYGFVVKDEHGRHWTAKLGELKATT